MWLWRTSASAPLTTPSDPADSEEVERAIEVRPVALGAQDEVPLGDRRREAVVEGLRDPEAPVHVVPAGVAQRELVDAELACVEEPQQLDAGEVGGAERAELVRPVLLDVPRVPRALGALG